MDKETYLSKIQYFWQESEIDYKLLWKSLTYDKVLNPAIFSPEGIHKNIYFIYPDFEDVTGKSVFDLVHPDDVERIKGYFARVSKGEIVSYEVSVDDNDWETTLYPVKDEHGNVIAVSSLSRNIFERRALEKVNANLSALIECTPDTICFVTDDFRYEFINKAQPGWDKEELVGKKLDDFIDPEIAAEVKSKFLEAKKSGETVTAKTEVLRPDGHTAIYESRYMYIKDDANPRYMLITRDVTLEHRKQELIEEQKVRLLESSKLAALGEMSAGIAHEINNPLAIIQLQSDIMEMKLEKLIKDQPKLSEELSKSVSSIKNSISRVEEIVKGLRTFSRKEGKDSFTEQNLDSLLKDSINLARTQFAADYFDVQYENEFNDILINCHPGRISQVIINLISNAKDAIKELESRWIKVSVEKDATYIKVLVTDSGEGIAPEVCESIFDPFFTTKKVGDGTGLGLSISKTIVKDHGGKLFVDNSRKNTTFVLEIPYINFN